MFRNGHSLQLRRNNAKIEVCGQSTYNLARYGGFLATRGGTSIYNNLLNPFEILTSIRSHPFSRTNSPPDSLLAISLSPLSLSLHRLSHWGVLGFPGGDF